MIDPMYNMQHSLTGHLVVFKSCSHVSVILFLEGLKLSYMIFSMTDHLSKGLQSTKINCSDGSAMAAEVVKSMQDRRCETLFDELYEEVQVFAAKEGEFSLISIKT